MPSSPLIKSTTVVAVRHGNQIALGADGQATLGHAVVKGCVKKIHYLYNEQIMVGFAGSTGDALTLLDRLEGHLNAHGGKMRRAAIELSDCSSK